MSEQDETPSEAGTVGEEAVKLLGALQDWAKDLGETGAGAAEAGMSGATGALHDLNEHIASGGEDCRYCPVCRVIGAVRGTSPEVRQHLTTAATALVDAAAGLLATHVHEPGRGKRDEAPVEHIDLSEDDEWEDD